MPLRFITTELFEDAWFMDLPAKYKLFWIYLITRCDHTGIWQVNWKLAQFYTGDNLEPTEVLRLLKTRIVELDGGKYWFIPKFVHFQYKGELNETNKAHYKIIDNIKKYDLFDFLEKTKITKGANKGLDSPKQGVKDKDKVQVKDMVKDKYKHGDDVFLSDKEFTMLVDKTDFEIAKKCIEKLDNYKGATGKKYKSDYKAILNWVIDEVKKGSKNGTDKKQAPRGSFDVDKYAAEREASKPKGHTELVPDTIPKRIQ